MKRGTKLLSLAIVLAMALTMVSGLALADDRVTISYSMWGDDEEVRVLQNTIDNFESEQDAIHVEIIQIDRADYVGTLNTRAAGNNLPDTGIMAEDAVLMWAQQGMLMDVSDMYGEGESQAAGQPCLYLSG